MSTYSEIVFPTDGSDGSTAAFEHALTQARLHDARLHVLYVVDTTYAGVGSMETAIAAMREQGEATANELVGRAEADGIDAVAAIEEGDPYEEIVEYADSDVDLIVMGTHGRSGIDRYLLGSVTEKVVRTADAPVLTVRTQP
ncbi:universal stress protein [Natrarchaeobius chitinivorans]|uniref:Universal stress protein n=1 Tax=Natrarchaeobius chitinivorans TaxID=1679083 RepID=A0A3N6MM17_NATCH|nr:universal stress protein [Natrarchaeobius chitinivorans]RQG97091.1 universal stress protein [Natrarchaeobius chitinivorans]